MSNCNALENKLRNQLQLALEQSQKTQVWNKRYMPAIAQSFEKAKLEKEN